MAGLNVFTQMMIEAIMYVGIGLLLGCLIAVTVTPLVHNRAVRLTTRRLETALPQSMEEIQAGKDLLRAEFAMYARRLELINEWQKNKITSQLVELSKKSDVINWLKRDRDRLRMQVEALKQQLAAALDKAVFPGLQGGPLEHDIAAKAVAFGEAMRPEFASYIDQVLLNAKTMGAAMVECGLRLVSGGTDNHLLLVDLRSANITGKDAEALLERVGITVNKNAIPFDTLPPNTASGIRIGTPATTSRGFGPEEMRTVGRIIIEAIRTRSEPAAQARLAGFALFYVEGGVVGVFFEPPRNARAHFAGRAKQGYAGHREHPLIEI